MAKLATFSSNSFDWKNGGGCTTVGQLGIDRFPKDGFYIKSERSGRTILFIYDSATMEANEFFDGEACAFISSDNKIRMRIWV